MSLPAVRVLAESERSVPVFKAATLPAILLLAVSAAIGQDDFMKEIGPLFRQGKMDEIISRSEAYLAKHPDDPAPHHAIGRAYYYKSEFKNAVKHLERCLALGPKPRWQIGWTHCSLGMAYMRLEKLELAEKHLRQAIQLNATRNCTREARRALRELTGEDPWGKGPLVGRPLPEFEFHGLAGETYRLSDFKGSPVLFKVGPTW